MSFYEILSSCDLSSSNKTANIDQNNYYIQIQSYQTNQQNQMQPSPPSYQQQVEKNQKKNKQIKQNQSYKRPFSIQFKSSSLISMKSNDQPFNYDLFKRIKKQLVQTKSNLYIVQLEYGNMLGLSQAIVFYNSKNLNQAKKNVQKVKSQQKYTKSIIKHNLQQILSLWNQNQNASNSIVKYKKFIPSQQIKDKFENAYDNTIALGQIQPKINQIGQQNNKSIEAITIKLNKQLISLDNSINNRDQIIKINQDYIEKIKKKKKKAGEIAQIVYSVQQSNITQQLLIGCLRDILKVYEQQDAYFQKKIYSINDDIPLSLSPSKRYFTYYCQQFQQGKKVVLMQEQKIKFNQQEKPQIVQSLYKNESVKKNSCCQIM